MTAEQAVEALRALISLDGAFFPCLNPCGDFTCELAGRVLDILDEVR